MGEIPKYRVLIVDDEPPILSFITLKLENSGYEVITANNGKEAFAQVRAQAPDLIVLDIMMPGMDGLQALEKIRSVSSIPVIILSSMDTNLYKVKGLNSGADDYLVKPFHPDELVARIEAIRRRLDPEGKRDLIESVKIGDITINLQKHKLFIHDKEIPLARIEWLLLYELVQNRGKLLLYGDLLTKVWGVEYRDELQILQSWMSRIRRKIEKQTGNTRFIRTIAKAGYIIDDPVKQH